MSARTEFRIYEAPVLGEVRERSYLIIGLNLQRSALPEILAKMPHFVEHPVFSNKPPDYSDLHRLWEDIVPSNFDPQHNKGESFKHASSDETQDLWYALQAAITDVFIRDFLANRRRLIGMQLVSSTQLIETISQQSAEELGGLFSLPSAIAIQSDNSGIHLRETFIYRPEPGYLEKEDIVRIQRRINSIRWMFQEPTAHFIFESALNSLIKGPGDKLLTDADNIKVSLITLTHISQVKRAIYAKYFSDVAYVGINKVDNLTRFILALAVSALPYCKNWRDYFHPTRTEIIYPDFPLKQLR